MNYAIIHLIEHKLIWNTFFQSTSPTRYKLDWEKKTNGMLCVHRIDKLLLFVDKEFNFIKFYF